MAETPNIAAILAALAAQQQRPASAQQQQQQPIQQQYTQSYPQQSAPNPYPGQQHNAYTLPQPSNSGSMDLNAIKPTHSGVLPGPVSIAEAIAKAKAIANEKGISYDRPPNSYQQMPQMGRQPRSRSRSPPRRDNYGANPYRDERRNDRGPPPGRDMYGRERSFSPQPRGRAPPPATFSPRGANGDQYARNRSPQRGNDNVETIQVESNLVGLIIGRSGENLRRIEGETSVRVQFITGEDVSGPYRQCKITGPAQRRREAITEINRIIDESGMGSGVRPPPVDNRKPNFPAPAQNERAGSHQPALRDGEDSMQIMVPDRTVGLIIGRGGETIRDLQERSGCHVNIVGENKSINGLRPVNLIGSREAAAKAKDLIMEIVESDSKSQSEKRSAAPAERPQRDNGYGNQNYGGNNAQGGGDKITDSVFVPSEAVGMIIGKGGETIKEMQNTTGCKINVSPSSGPGETEREIGLVGSRDSIIAAKRFIDEKVDAVQQKTNGGGRRNNQRDSDYGNNDRGGYGQQQQQAYPAQASAGPPQAPPPGGFDPAAGGADPYAAYGGYQTYIALWYQALAKQQQEAAARGEQQQPPGA